MIECVNFRKDVYISLNLKRTSDIFISCSRPELLTDNQGIQGIKKPFHTIFYWFKQLRKAVSKISLSILKLSQYTMLNVVLRHLPSENERNFFRFGVFLIFFPSPTSALDSSSLLVDIIRTKLRRMPIESS